MTIIGIAGSTALMLPGFGLQYSIGVIVTKQLDEIFVSDVYKRQGIGLKRTAELPNMCKQRVWKK